MYGDPVSYSDPEGDMPFIAVAAALFVGSVLVNKGIELFQSKVLKQNPQGAVWSFGLHNNGLGSFTRNPIVFRDWYWNEEEGYIWFPDSGDKEGWKWIGPNIYLPGAGNTLIYHEQNRAMFTTTYDPDWPLLALLLLQGLLSKFHRKVYLGKLDCPVQAKSGLYPAKKML
jgi:hypothetical protein